MILSKLMQATPFYMTTIMQFRRKAEIKAAIRVFGLLPEDQRREFINLWEEFEKKETPEAKFAAALDRLEPLIQNAHTEGHAWIKHRITKDQVINKDKLPLMGGSEELWGYAG
jgi:putative hydrolase of HD superfamily